MLPGLQQGQEKMSKSDPSSAIYMEDEEVQFFFVVCKLYVELYEISSIFNDRIASTILSYTLTQYAAFLILSSSNVIG